MLRGWANIISPEIWILQGTKSGDYSSLKYAYISDNILTIVFPITIFNHNIYIFFSNYKILLFIENWEKTCFQKINRKIIHYLSDQK